MAELNGLEPSSAWLTTKCLTSQPQFRICALFFVLCSLHVQARKHLKAVQEITSSFARDAKAQSTKLKAQRTICWVGRRELNPHGPQSQCGALPFELRPTQKGDKERSVTSHFGDVVTISIRPKGNASWLACDDVEWPRV